MTAVTRSLHASRLVAPRSVALGVAGGALLLLVYLTIISLAQGFEHAVAQLAADATFVGLIAAGFSTQMALFAELRAVDRIHRSSAAVTVGATGTSAAAMLACCAHHLVELLPLLGLSAAAVFLNAYKTPLFMLGIVMNMAGIIVITRQLRRARRACAVVEAAQTNSAHGWSHGPLIRSSGEGETL
ncbi:MAG: hypothetical protein ABI725_00915 [Chloroflexota bacterium]